MPGISKPETVVTPTDHGLFGPGSVTWRVSYEPILWVGGLRAMYLQALHPRTMRATWQNTAFARPGEAWGRFARTVEFVRIRTYGSTMEVERAGRRVRKVHASLTGTDEDGSVIRLDEPELLLWVHCGEVGQVRRKILTLPEEIHKVLRHIVALVEEVAHHNGFARVHVVAEDAGRTTHDRGFLVGFLHRVWSCIALRAATVTVTRAYCVIEHNIPRNIKELENY